MISTKVLIYIIILAICVIFAMIKQMISHALDIQVLTISNIAYDIILGFLSGFFVFWMTVQRPLNVRRKEKRPILHEWLVNIYSEISIAVANIPYDQPKTSSSDFIPFPNDMDVLPPNVIGDTLSKIAWNNTTCILNRDVPIKNAMEYYMDSLRSKVQSILDIYGEILSPNEIRYLNVILMSDVYARLHFTNLKECNNINNTIHTANEIRIILDSLWRCVFSLESR